MITKKHIVFFVGGFLLLALFTAFSYVVDKEVLRQIDFDTTVRLQDLVSRRFDGIFSLFSIFGNFEVLTVVLIVTLLLLRKVIAGVVAFAAFGMFHIIEIFGKTVVEQLPPPQFLLRTEHAFDFPQFHVRLEYSYPSGHSGRTAFLTILLGFLIWRSKLPLSIKVVLLGGLVGFAIVMFVSRVYLGEHWLTDVVGGAVLGASFSLMSIGVYLVAFKKKFL